jgi:hypothetical protein
MNTPSTQMNTRCDLGNPIWEKIQLEGEAYSLLSFSQLRNSSTKKGTLTMDFPWTLWPEWLLHNILHPMLWFNILLLYSLLKYGTIKTPKEWNPFLS